MTSFFTIFRCSLRPSVFSGSGGLGCLTDKVRYDFPLIPGRETTKIYSNVVSFTANIFF